MCVCGSFVAYKSLPRSTDPQDTHARFVGRDGCEEGCLCEVRRVSVCPVCRVCTGSLRCLFTGTCGERSTPGLRLFLRLLSRSRFSCGFVSLFGFGWMVVRFVRVIRLPACARVSRVSRVCPGSPGVFSPGRAVGFPFVVQQVSSPRSRWVHQEGRNGAVNESI